MSAVCFDLAVNVFVAKVYVMVLLMTRGPLLLTYNLTRDVVEKTSRSDHNMRLHHYEK